MEPGPRDPVPQDPGTRGSPQSLKVGPGIPLKFKDWTSGPHPKFKGGTPGPSSKFKSGNPSPFFNEFIFSEYFIHFVLLIYFCVFFK